MKKPNMKSRKNRFFPLILLGAFILMACDPNMDTNITPYSEEDLNQPLPRSFSTGNDAKKIASLFIKNWVLTTPPSSCGDWNENTTITKIVPVFNDGLDQNSYYECKATTNGRDSGYVLVTMDNSDILIPEFNTVGPTISDEVDKAIGNGNYDLYRYGFSGVRAVQRDTARATGTNPAERKTLCAMGVPGFDKNLAEWRNKVKSDGVMPYYSRRYFNALRLSYDASQDYYFSASSRHGASEDIEPASLKNSFSDGMFTPTWTQAERRGDQLNQSGLDAATLYPLGCGPTAWQIVYGYWQAFKGKTNLFPGVDISQNRNSNGSYNDVIASAGLTIAYMTNTWWGINILTQETFGCTGPEKWNMEKGINYANAKLYTSSKVDHTLNALFQFEMYRKVKASLDADRPCIISIATSGGEPSLGIAVTHYVVVEQCKKTRYREKIGLAWWPWANGSTNYFVNMGWGNLLSSSARHRWIVTCDVDPYNLPPGPLTSMWDVYDITVQ